MNLYLHFMLSFVYLLLAEENIECDESGACLQQELNPRRINRTGDINCHGLGSCFGSTIINNNLDSITACHGKRSCQNLVSLSGIAMHPADVRGYLGLAWTEKIENITTVIGCGSEAACYGIKNIIRSESMSIEGHMGSAAINLINNIKTIEANGSFALKDSVIRITNSSTVDNSSEVFVASMFGFYSGYNATIYCETGRNCSIVCQTNGCENLNFICDVTSGNSHCSVSCNNNDGIICPNGWQNGMNNYNYNYNYSGTGLKLGYLWLLDNLSNITYGLDEYFNITRLDTRYISYYNVTHSASDIDEYFDYECRHNNVNAEFSICGDAYLCEHYTMEYTDGNTNICCSGVGGCKSGKIKLNFTYESNIRSNLNNTNSTATIRHNLYCDADIACRFANIVLFNRRSSSNNNNDYTDNIYCRGKHSCSYGINIDNFDKVICSGKKSCFAKAAMNNGNVVACLGGLSCNRASITNVRTVIATGSFSMSGSNITNEGGRDLDIYLLGYQSSFGLSITCQTGTSCRVYCMNIDTCNATIEFSCSSKIGICFKEFVSLNPIYYNYSDYDTDNNDLPNPTSFPTSMTTSSPTPMPSSITTLEPTNIPSMLPSYSILPTNMYTYMPHSSSTSAPSIGNTPSNQPTNLPSDINTTVESIFTTINLNTTQNIVNSNNDGGDDDDDGIGDIKIVIGNEDIMGDDTYNLSVNPNATTIVYSNSSHLQSKLRITFTILLDLDNMDIQSDSMNSHKNDTPWPETTSNTDEQILIPEQLGLLSTQITSFFKQHFDVAVGHGNDDSSKDDNDEPHEIYINTTIEFVDNTDNTENKANTSARRMLHSPSNDNTSTYANSSVSDTEDTATGSTSTTGTSVQVDTIIIIDNEVIDSANSSYFHSIGNVFYLILHAAGEIFNITDATIDDITIFVTIVPVIDDNESGGTFNDDEEEEEEDVNDDGFWTPEMIAVLMMVGVALCVVSCVLFCCIVFCCKKSQQLSKDGTLAQKHLSYSEDETPMDDSARMRIKSQSDQNAYKD